MLKILYGHAARNLGDVAITYGVVGMLEEIGYGKDYRFFFPATTSAPAIAAREEIANAIGPEHCEVLDIDSIPELVAARLPDERGDYVSLMETLVEDVTAKFKDTGLGVEGRTLFNACEHLFSYRSNPRPRELLARILPMYVATAGMSSLPSTFGPFEDERSEQIASRFFRDLQHVAGREATTAGLLAACEGVAASPLSTGLLDPAFFMPQLRVARARLDVRRKTAVLVPRLDQFGLRVGIDASRDHSRALKEEGFESSAAFRIYRDIGLRLAAAKVRVILLVQTSSDAKICKTLRTEIRSKFPTAPVRVVTPASIEEWVRVINHATSVITSRFHSAILALALGRPVSGIYFEEHGAKLPGLFQQFCLDNRVHACGGSSYEKNSSVIVETALHLNRDVEAQEHEIRRLLRRETLAYVSVILTQ